jgi:hypothetical protein
MLAQLKSKRTDPEGKIMCNMNNLYTIYPLSKISNILHILTSEGLGIVNLHDNVFDGG